MSTHSRPACLFCGSSALITQEHVFRRSWKDQLGRDKGLEEFREFHRRDINNNVLKEKSEDLFLAIVKRVCAQCNNTWMNDLDTLVEPWVFDPMNDENRCDSVEFRCWAIKVALLRCHYENHFRYRSRRSRAPPSRRYDAGMACVRGAYEVSGASTCILQCWASPSRYRRAGVRSNPRRLAMPSLWPFESMGPMRSQ